MSVGQGNITFTRKPPAPAPAGVTGARNGLSIDALLNAVLGQDVGEAGNPAALLSNREIPLDGFSIAFNDAIGNLFTIDPANGIYSIGDRDNYADPVFWLTRNAGNPQADLYIQDVGGNYVEFFNYINAGEGRSDLYVSGAAGETNVYVRPETFEVASNGSNTSLSLDWVNEVYSIGDIPTLRQYFTIDNSNSANPFALTSIRNTPGGDLVEAFHGFSGGLPSSISNVLSGTGQTRSINRGFEYVIDNNAGTEYLNIDQTIGETFIGSGNMQMLMIENGAAAGLYAVNGGWTGLSIAFNDGEYIMGDGNVTQNGNTVIVNDTLETAGFYKRVGSLLHFEMQALNDAFVFDNLASNVSLWVNGVQGVTGTFSPVNSITVNGGIVTAVS